MNLHPAEQDGPNSWTLPLETTSDCRAVEDALDEYVLGVIDASQRVAVERHLIRCRHCSDLVESYESTVAALAFAVPLVMPPANAKSVLMARIATTPQSSAYKPSVYAGSLETLRTPTLPSSAEVSGTLAPMHQSQTSWWKVYAAPLATLPLILALGLVGAWGFNNYAKLDAANGTIDEQAALIDHQQQQLAFDDREAVRLAFSPSAKRYNLVSELTSDGSMATGQLIADPITGQAMVQVDGLTPGSYAVVVQTQDGSMVEKALFYVAAGGSASTLVDLDEQVSDFRSVHIRSNDSITQTDVAVDGEPIDVMMAVIGPDINENSDTGQQAP